MKKVLVFGLIAGAAVLMGSCSKDAANSEFSQNAIEFGTYLGRDAQTRGTVMDNAALMNMGVYASYTGQTAYAGTLTPNFMYNQVVTKGETAWSYSPVKYWPTTSDDKISFFAYAPYSTESNNVVAANSDNKTAGAPTLTVTLPADLTKMVDFVAGVQMNKTHDAANSAVKFNLKHELTRLGIMAKVSKDVWAADGDKNKTKVVITDIKLDNVTNGQFYKSGVYTFSTTEGENGTWNGTVATEALDLSSLQTKESYKVGTGYDKKGIILEGTSAKSLFTDNQYLFLIPANGATGLTADKATVTVTYDIVTTDGNLDGGCSVTNAVKTVKIPTGSLKQGTAYTLTLTINVDEVKLDAEVANWATDTNNVTVDYSSSDATE